MFDDGLGFIEFGDVKQIAAVQFSLGIPTLKAASHLLSERWDAGGFPKPKQMKTPQEEAERLSAKVYLEWFNHQGPCYQGPRSYLPIFMANEIPLAQLIAVARAAKKLVQNADGELLIDTYFSKEGAELLAALQSLRATGKVTI